MTTLAFHRPARRFPQMVEDEAVQIAAPPQVQPGRSNMASMLQTVLFPLMGVAGMGYVLFIPGTPAVLKVLMGGLAVVMVLGSLLTAWTTSRETRMKKRSDANKYQAYLDRQTQKLDDAATVQRAGLERVHPQSDALLGLVSGRTHVWERRADHSDFLHVRLGLGSVPLAMRAELEHRNDPMVEYEPELHSAVTQLVGQYTQLPQAPFAVELKDLNSLAITGADADTENVARTLICQTATAHSPSDVIIAAYFPPERRAQWEWMKWLPHCRDQSSRANGSGPACLLADSAEAFRGMLARLATERSTSVPAREGASPKSSTRLIVIVDGYAPRTPVAAVGELTSLLEDEGKSNSTVIALVRDRNDEPTRVNARIEVEPGGKFQFEVATSGGTSSSGFLDRMDVETAESIARALAPLRLRDDQATTGGASSGTLFKLLGLSGPDAVDPARSWRPRAPSTVMQVPLGIRDNGEPLVLDLKEAAAGGMGPHGLIVGATGSGKSELLRTFVTGLAINHSPDILSFVFVDFKGGAAFADLAELPHVAGMITNLQGDLSRVDRMYAALVGEQERRQRLLRTAGNVDGIKEYQALYTKRPDMEPMPYLVIVVDEFGELLVARPDFLDLFNAIGRVGRSLGMHLLLASQRLEEGRIRGLEGHLRYRICLRTFSGADSQAVLGTQDAYHLPSTPGAGYFKVDTTIYQRFQTAHISAPYQGSLVKRGKSTGAKIAPFTGLFELTAAAPGATADVNADAPTDMEVAIRKLRDRARGLMRPVHQVWLPPLANAISLGEAFELSARNHGVDPSAPRPFGYLRTPVGVLDVPAEQTQIPYVVDFSGGNGHLAVAGAPQTGKSTLLKTLMTSFAFTHSPEDVQFYCIDLGGGALHPLEELPHVGAVCGKLDKDRARRLIREMHAIVEERELAFRRGNIDSMTSYRAQRQAGAFSSDTATDVFLIIDNWGQFRVDFEDIEPDVALLLANGLAYGIHVVITANRWADLRAQYKDNIGFRLEFRLNDPTESEMPRGASKTLPQNISGRCLTQQALHFQVALPVLQAGDSGNEIYADAAKRWQEAIAAPPIRLLPSLIRASELPDPAHFADGVPLGLDEFRLQPVGLDLFSSDPHFLIAGDSECGKSNLIRLWMDQLMRRYTPDEVQFVLVDFRRALLDAGTEEYLHRYAPTPNLTSEALEQLKQDLITRLPGADVTREQLVTRSWWRGPEYVVFVDDYDLVVSPTGNPISTLVELLPQGRDVGLHLVLARRVGGMARSSFETVLQRVRELGTPGLIMNGDPQEGPILGTQKATGQPAGRGFLVRRGERTLIVQTALAEEPA